MTKRLVTNNRDDFRHCDCDECEIYGECECEVTSPFIADVIFIDGKKLSKEFDGIEWMFNWIITGAKHNGLSLGTDNVLKFIYPTKSGDKEIYADDLYKNGMRCIGLKNI